jgi:penicillin-binding protein A
VNTPARRLYILITALFAVLVFATAWWTVGRPDALRDNTENKRALLEQQQIHRGTIRASDGTVLARSVKVDGGIYTRRYSAGDADVSQAVGYSYTNLGQVGIEKYRNSELVGETNGIESFVDEVLGRQPEGNDVTTTLDLAAQKVALQQLAGRKGAVVAMEPDTGKIRVMASVPGFDANDVRDPKAYAQLNRDDVNAPLFNRATQGSYPPGSTFKVVTAAAALDSGKYTPDSIVNGDSPQVVSGVPLQNDYGESFGDITLTKALTLSVNTAFAKIGEDLGKPTMSKYMKRFGFEKKPPLDYPAEQMLASGEYDLKTGNLLPVTSPRVDVGRMAMGQDKLQVTPLQMASVAATVANGGVRVEPRLTDKIVDPDGRVVDDVKPVDAQRVMSQKAASELGEMMQNVVREGTGTAAALSGIDVAGKTGTAQIDPSRNITQPWFIAYAPADNPKMAIAVTIERSNGGFGGTEAAPIAKAVLEQLLGSGANG